MNYLISIIVPVYNAEMYLRRCIDALLGQTYDNIEVILISDGSTDGSDLICEEYARRDGRVRYYRQKNHGQGYTRARGVELAKGDYVAFADADDRMQPQTYGSMITAIKRDGTDMCVCQWNYELPGGEHTINNRIYPDSFYGVKTAEEFARYLYAYKEQELTTGYGYANGVVASPWNKLFRRDLLLGFESNGYLGEDEEMNDFVLSKPGVKVSVIPDELYYWCQNLESISHRPFSGKRWYYLKMLSKRTELYTDKYILGETHKLICNIGIEYYYKGISAACPPPICKIFNYR